MPKSLMATALLETAAAKVSPATKIEVPFHSGLMDESGLWAAARSPVKKRQQSISFDGFKNCFRIIIAAGR